MLSKEEQLKEWDRVVTMCKDTKFEGKEYLCVKYEIGSTWHIYTPGDLDINLHRSRSFAIAIVDNTPIWLEEPFKVYSKYLDVEFVYDANFNKLLGTSYTDYATVKIGIPIEQVRWEQFTLDKARNLANSIDGVQAPSTDNNPDTKQIGGTHYKDKVIQPWEYMEALFTKEEFVGFLRGNAHKYLSRYKDKNGIEDLKKAIHYIEKLIQVENKQSYNESKYDN